MFPPIWFPFYSFFKFLADVYAISANIAVSMWYGEIDFLMRAQPPPYVITYSPDENNRKPPATRSNRRSDRTSKQKARRTNAKMKKIPLNTRARKAPKSRHAPPMINECMKLLKRVPGLVSTTNSETRGCPAQAIEFPVSMNFCFIMLFVSTIVLQTVSIRFYKRRIRTIINCFRWVALIMFYSTLIKSVGFGKSLASQSPVCIIPYAARQVPCLVLWLGMIRILYY